MGTDDVAVQDVDLSSLELHRMDGIGEATAPSHKRFASCCLIPLALIATGIAGAGLMMTMMSYESLISSSRMTSGTCLICTDSRIFRVRA